SIFDEIDVNIGGETAVRVGEELRRLGEQRQLLCISHLAQVAVQADRHFAVAKSVENNRASTRVIQLEGPARQTEIARMLGGGNAADEHAAKLLKAAGK
ncbi:MAG: DNA repair protein RecN, partial [Lentisphaeria bacterium]|nr:DNA repair protein RecN [Lentisphaeria bacterium]